MKIIYQNPDGAIHVITPITDCGLTIEEIAAKDVPSGLPFRIVEDEVLPADHEQQQAWETDFTDTAAPVTVNPAKVIAPNPIVLAEAWVRKFFTDVQLLKMAMWVQQKGTGAGQKLSSVYEWEEGVSLAAIGGAVTYEDAPFTFAEVATEVLTA